MENDTRMVRNGKETLWNDKLIEKWKKTQGMMKRNKEMTKRCTI
jgi:hypothetical protein